MKLIKKDLEWLSDQEIISNDQVNKIWFALGQKYAESPKFDFVHLVYYFGAFIIMSAMGWFMNDAWGTFGGTGLAAISLLYISIFVGVGKNLWSKHQVYLGGGLLFTLAVWMVPLFVFGLENSFGFWPQGDPGSFTDYHKYIKGSWIVMELATVLAGLGFLKYIKFPFLTFPIAYALWFLSMDLAPLFYGEMQLTFEGRKYVSIIFGFLILIGAYYVDRKTEKDYAFWGYLFGVMAFWGGLSLLDSGSELGKFVYCMINLGLMVVSVLLQRKVFMVFGVLGVVGYLGHLAFNLFEDSLAFPFVLSMFGGFMIYLAIKLQKNYDHIVQRINQKIPEKIKSYFPPINE